MGQERDVARRLRLESDEAGATGPGSTTPVDVADGARPCPGCGQAADSDECGHCGAVSRAGEFRILRVLNQSERGRLYLAEDATGARAALKELAFALVPDARRLEAFEREGELLRQLHHPRIPKFIAAFRTGEGVRTRLYLAQEYFDGVSLEAELDGRRYDEADAVEVARDVLEVLGYLHGLSPPLLHRDLKPANLIRGSDGRVVVVDFGAARDLAGPRLTGATIVGTFGYVPIEQLGGTVDASSDLYALGATLIHLLSRKRPEELYSADFTLEFEPYVNVSPHLLTILRRLVARSPEQRFQHVSQVIRELDALEHAPTEPTSEAPAPGAAMGVTPTNALGIPSGERLPPTAPAEPSARLQLAIVLVIVALIAIPGAAFVAWAEHQSALAAVDSKSTLLLSQSFDVTENIDDRVTLTVSSASLRSHLPSAPVVSGHTWLLVDYSAYGSTFWGVHLGDALTVRTRSGRILEPDPHSTQSGNGYGTPISGQAVFDVPADDPPAALVLDHGDSIPLDLVPAK